MLVYPVELPDAIGAYGTLTGKESVEEYRSGLCLYPDCLILVVGYFWGMGLAMHISGKFAKALVVLVL